MPKSETRNAGTRQAKADALFERANELWDQGELRSAFRLFLSAAKAGDTSAQVDLGYFYNNGIGVKPNVAAALYWYKRAYRRKSRSAASNIGTIFRDQGDFKRALWWYERSVALGNADANLEIAKIYLKGGAGEAARAIPYLQRTCSADPSDVTEASREEAQQTLKKLGKRCL